MFWGFPVHLRLHLMRTTTLAYFTTLFQNEVCVFWTLKCITVNYGNLLLLSLWRFPLRFIVEWKSGKFMFIFNVLNQISSRLSHGRTCILVDFSLIRYLHLLYFYASNNKFWRASWYSKFQSHLRHWASWVTWATLSNYLKKYIWE